MKTRRTGRRGAAAAAALFLVVVCAGIAGGALISNANASKEAQTVLARERAFQAAEGGLDWALTKLRITRGVIPALLEETGTVSTGTTYTVRYSEGTADGIDEDGNGTIDDAGEADYCSFTATGVSGGVRRTLQCILRKTVTIPDFPGAGMINSEVPVVDLNGNSFTISGSDHLIDGTLDTSEASRYALSSSATIVSLVLQIASGRYGQLTGIGSTPSVGTTEEIDLAGLIAEAAQAASIELSPGTHSSQTLGTATADGIEVVYCDGDLHLSGGGSGAGILAVDGDLDISGGFEWVGIILCSGRINFVGGGSGNRLIGAFVAGEEFRCTGTVDVLYSSDAVGLASLGLAVPVVMTWREIGGL